MIKNVLNTLKSLAKSLNIDFDDALEFINWNKLESHVKQTDNKVDDTVLSVIKLLKPGLFA